MARDGISAAAFRANPRRTLAATFDRSWDVLLPRQQRLFAGLALLAGASFPRAAALAPAAPATDNGETADTEADTAALVTYALVEPLANDRLRLHPLLREYAAAKLRVRSAPPSKLPWATPRSPTGSSIINNAEAHPGYDGMDALEAEAPGLMGAIAWAHSNERDRELLALAKALSRAWDVRGRRNDELTMYAWAESAAKRLNDAQEERWALHQLTVTYSQTGRLSEARAGYARALEIARQLGDPAAERAETHGLAVLNHNTGQLDIALAQYERALELARQLGDPQAQAVELRNMGNLMRHRGDLDGAKALVRESLALSERLNDVYSVAKAHQFIAWIDGDASSPPAAIAHYREALRRFEQVRSPEAEAMRAALRELGAEP